MITTTEKSVSTDASSSFGQLCSGNLNTAVGAFFKYLAALRGSPCRAHVDPSSFVPRIRWFRMSARDPNTTNASFPVDHTFWFQQHRFSTVSSVSSTSREHPHGSDQVRIPLPSNHLHPSPPSHSGSISQFPALVRHLQPVKRALQNFSSWCRSLTVTSSPKSTKSSP